MSNREKLIFLPLLLLLGGAWSLSLDADEDGEVLRPFMSNSQIRRICVDLCLSGLGGLPCGEECADITPQDLPIQSKQNNGSGKNVNVTRENSCSILCINNLGHPLCNCDQVKQNDKKAAAETDFIQICSYFCVTFEYQLRGCQKCSVYRSVFSGSLNSRLSSELITKYQTSVDWETWCLNQCSIGNGGAACNCDRLPM